MNVSNNPLVPQPTPPNCYYFAPMPTQVAPPAPQAMSAPVMVSTLPSQMPFLVPLPSFTMGSQMQAVMPDQFNAHFQTIFNQFRMALESEKNSRKELEKELNELKKRVDVLEKSSHDSSTFQPVRSGRKFKPKKAVSALDAVSLTTLI
jgi:hypothetical protein